MLKELMSRSGKISEHSLPNSFNERCSRVAKKFFGGQGKSLHRWWHETAIAVVMSCRALPPKLPDTSDALTQMRLQKMQLSRSQLWGILGAPLQNWGDCGHSCRSCTLTEVNAYGKGLRLQSTGVYWPTALLSSVKTNRGFMQTL